ncbi:MAG: DUF1353 domain-containing protein [Hyphomicrobiaceae bacterium]
MRQIMTLAGGLRLAAVIVVTVGLGGCLDMIYGWRYDQTKSGELKGTLRIQWLAQDKFLYEPDPTDPLIFKRADGTVIEPAAMYTDGGSIPQALRAIKAYSPWGYAPAFLLHDWLFAMKQCRYPGYEKLTLEDAANVMAEAMKTLMEKPNFGGVNKLVHYSMYEGVLTRTARDYWDNGPCDAPGATMKRLPTPATTRSLATKKIESGTSAEEAPYPTFTIKIP